MEAFVEEKVELIKQLNPCLVVLYNLNHILGINSGADLMYEVSQSKWVKLLREQQGEEGGYGRFHTRDSKSTGYFHTTEKAVDSMKYIGLRRGFDVVDRCCCYMESILDNNSLWPDNFEKNIWYRPAVPLFISSKLSNFGSDNSKYKEYCSIYLELLKQAFFNGEYDAERINRFSKAALGCDVHNRYPGIFSKYAINLFANIEGQISDSLQDAYLCWIRNKVRRVFYLNVNLTHKEDNDLSELIILYYTISRFRRFKIHFSDHMEWLHSMQNRNGLWDFSAKHKFQKYSDDWKTRNKRLADHSTTILYILK